MPHRATKSSAAIILLDRMCVNAVNIKWDTQGDEVECVPT
jgi:hypothetical protein